MIKWMWKLQTGTAVLVLLAVPALGLSRGKAPRKKATHKVARKLRARQTAPETSAQSVMNGSTPQSYPQGDFFGTPGLWNTQLGETLPTGGVSAGIYLQRYTREPGAQVFTDFSSAWSVGITKWLELNFGMTPYRRDRVGSPEQLSFRNNGTFTSFNNDNPFARNSLLHGPAYSWVGLTFGLLSQDRGDPIGFALQPYVRIPFRQDYNSLINSYGVGTGEFEEGMNLLADKWLGNAGTIAVNLGFRHINEADAGHKIALPLRNEALWSFGVIFPRKTRLQGIVEDDGSIPYGAGVHSNYFGPTSPVDTTMGIRFSPAPWIGINAGYRLADNAKYGNDDGWVFGVSFGSRMARPVPPPPPSVTCSADATVVQPGTVVHITSTVTPQGLPYTYTWNTSGGTLTPASSQAQLDTTGLAPGLYTVTETVDNGQGGTGSCSTNVEVREKPKHPPVVSASAYPSSVLPGASVTLTAQASSPDNRPLTYSWTVTGGKLDSTNQAVVHLDTTGVAPGTDTATVTVTDDRGLSAQASANVTIQTPPPPPQASLATTCKFRRNSARVDNVCKAQLDDVALRLQQDTTASGVIVGFAQSDEHAYVPGRSSRSARSLRLAQERAANTETYLVKTKGIDASRLELRADNSSGGQNAEVWIVPQGANYTGPGQTFDASILHARRHR